MRNATNSNFQKLFSGGNFKTRKFSNYPVSFFTLGIEDVSNKALFFITSITYSKVSNKRTVFNNRTGGDIILQKI